MRADEVATLRRKVEKAEDLLLTISYIQRRIQSIENLNVKDGNEKICFTVSAHTVDFSGDLPLTTNSKKKLLELLNDMKTYNEHLLEEL